MRPSIRTISLLTVCCLGFAERTAADEPMAAQIAVEDVLAAWKARRQEVQTLRIEYEETRHVLRGSEFGRGFRPADDNDELFPPHDCTLTRHHTFIIHGDHWRHDRRGEVWNYMAEQFLPEHYIETYDGEEFVSFYRRDAGTDEHHHIAFIHAPIGNRNPESVETHATGPIVHLFRFNQSGFRAFNPDRWTVLPEPEVIGNEPFIVIERKGRLDDKRYWRYWLDPRHGYRAVRQLGGGSGRPGWQTDINYDAEGDALQEWTSGRYLYDDDGTSEYAVTVTYRVLNVEINGVVDSSEIKVEFPVGTKVADRLTGSYIAYLILPERDIFEITSELSGKSYTELWKIAQQQLKPADAP